MLTGTNNRLFERINGELTVRYSPQGTDGEFCSTTKNISGSGLRMTLLKKLNPGTILDLEVFKHGTNITARCRGKIVWVWPSSTDREDSQVFDTGIKFIDQRLLHIGKLISYLKNDSQEIDA